MYRLNRVLITKPDNVLAIEYHLKSPLPPNDFLLLSLLCSHSVAETITLVCTLVSPTRDHRLLAASGDFSANNMYKELNLVVTGTDYVKITLTSTTQSNIIDLAVTTKLVYQDNSK